MACSQEKTNHTPALHTLVALVEGDNRDNALRGTHARDTLRGFGGDDTMNGYDEDDRMFSGKGATR